jgi:hypothetical protein
MVARIFLGTSYQNRKNVPNEHKTYTCTNGHKLSQNISKGLKIYQHFSIKGPQKFTQNIIFGLKINHLATLRPQPSRRSSATLTKFSQSFKINFCCFRLFRESSEFEDKHTTRFAQGSGP